MSSASLPASLAPACAAGLRLYGPGGLAVILTRSDGPASLPGLPRSSLYELFEASGTSRPKLGPLAIFVLSLKVRPWELFRCRSPFCLLAQEEPTYPCVSNTPASTGLLTTVMRCLTAEVGCALNCFG